MAEDDKDKRGGDSLPEGVRPRYEGVHDVRLNRTRAEPTNDRVLWVAIRAAANRIAFPEYLRFIDDYMAEPGRRQAGLPFSTGVNAYAKLKKGTETFLETRCGIVPPPRRTLAEPREAPSGAEPVQAFREGGERGGRDFELGAEDLRVEEGERFGDFREFTPEELEAMWRRYRVKATRAAGSEVDRRRDEIQLLPYLDIIRNKLGEYPIAPQGKPDDIKVLMALIQERLCGAPMMELIWSYWHEEGMLAQTMAAIGRRFQNIRNGARDPLANLEIDPLRPLNAIVWGYLQDEQHRLTVKRRAYEYDHHYGFTLHGKAVADFRPADSRKRFIEAFHNLLCLMHDFYGKDDDTTVVADGFPLLTALREVHLLLTEGGHNQHGDLPWTARHEMLMEQWILARPEMREFIGGRVMVAYPEPWMDRVDTMKTLQGWDPTNSVHFRDLGVFGEQLLLSMRYGNWIQVIQPDNAANWARYWRAECMGYVAAYRAVTGVDLRAHVTDSRPLAERNQPPSYHLRNRLLAQARTR
jgi:hypothetical protein